MQKKGKLKFTYFSKKHALYQSVIISGITNCILIVGALHGTTGANWQGYLQFFLWHFCSNVILYYLLFRLNFRIILSHIKFVNTSLIAIVGTISLSLLFSPVLTQLQWLALNVNERIPVRGFIYFNLAKDLMLGVIVILVTRYIYANHKRDRKSVV